MLQGQSDRDRDLNVSRHRSNFMSKRPTFITTGDISKYTKASNLLERVMKTIGNIHSIR
jgi:hypothetical protein